MVYTTISYSLIDNDRIDVKVSNGLSNMLLPEEYTVFLFSEQRVKRKV